MKKVLQRLRTYRYPIPYGKALVLQSVYRFLVIWIPEKYVIFKLSF